MPIQAIQIKAINDFFESRHENFKINLELFKSRLPIEKRLKIKNEVAHKKIFNAIKASAINYYETTESIKDIREKSPSAQTMDDMKNLCVLESEKEKAVNEFAHCIETLMNICELKFIDDTKPFYFWGSEAGEYQAYADSALGKKANVFAFCAENELFKAFLGPLHVSNNPRNADEKTDAKTIDYHFPPEKQGGFQYVLQELFYSSEKSTTPEKRLSIPNLPELSNMLWSALSVVYAKQIVAVITKAKNENRAIPPAIVYLPEQIDRDSNFWLWELPSLQQITKHGAVISYVKLSPEGRWIETNFDDYNILRRIAATKAPNPLETIEENGKLAMIEKKYEGKSYFYQDKRISVSTLKKYASFWKKNAANKDRERPLSIMLSVLKTAKGKMSSYQEAGINTKKDLESLSAFQSTCDIIWLDTKIPHSEKVTKIKEHLMRAYYSPTFKLAPENLPKTVIGKLKLLEVAKSYHQYDIVFDILKKDQTISKSIQANEIYLWALIRKAESYINLTEEARNALLEEARKTIESILNVSPNNICVLFEKGKLAEVQAYFISNPAEKAAALKGALLQYTQNIMEHNDATSGAKYIQLFSTYYVSPNDDEIALLKKISEKTYALLEMHHIDECDEPVLLRSALLSALVLNDSQKMERVKARMMSIKISPTEIGYTSQIALYDTTQRKKFIVGHTTIFNDISKKQEHFKTASTAHSKKPEDRFLQSSYDYRQSLATYYGGVQRGGNIRFGGVLPQQLITKSDIRIFSDLLLTPIKALIPSQTALEVMVNHAALNNNAVAKKFFEDALEKFYTTVQPVNINQSLSHLTDIPKVLEIISFIVSLNFQGIADCYDPEKAGYRQLDHVMLAMNRITTDAISAKNAHYDTATSLSIMFGLRTGDCRHHAESMQLLFDIWKYQQVTSLLSDEVLDKAKYDALLNTQLRVIDTLEALGDQFTYAHTFNVLETKNPTGQSTYTVYDAFDLNQAPEQVSLRIENDDLLFETHKKTTQSNPTHYKFTAYAGDKGKSKATEHLSLLGRTGITEASVFQSITNNKMKTEIAATVKELAEIEKARKREEIGLDALFEMIVIKGYGFDYDPTVEEKPEPAEMTDLISEFCADKNYPEKTKQPNDERLYAFYHEILRRESLQRSLLEKVRPALNDEEKQLLHLSQQLAKTDANNTIKNSLLRDIVKLLKDEGPMDGKLYQKLITKKGIIPTITHNDIIALRKQLTESKPTLFSGKKKSEESLVSKILSIEKRYITASQSQP